MRFDIPNPTATPIQMADGSEKPIERVRAGDTVLTRDEWSGEQSAGKVTRTFKTAAGCGEKRLVQIRDTETNHMIYSC